MVVRNSCLVLMAYSIPLYDYRILFVHSPLDESSFWFLSITSDDTMNPLAF